MGGFDGSGNPEAMPIRILHLEDDVNDSTLLIAFLDSEGIAATLLRVDEESGFRAALREFRPDLILSDYHLPRFDGPAALALCMETVPEIPFLFLSGKIGEEAAVDTLKRGAMDFVMKNSLSRLPHAIARARTEAREKLEKRAALEELRESRARLSTLIDNSPDAIWSVDADLRLTAFNTVALENIRVSGGQAPRAGDAIADLFPEDLLQQWTAWFRRALKGERFRMEQAHSEGGQEIHYEVSLNPIKGGDVPTGVVVVSRNITERKRAEREIIAQRDELRRARAAEADAVADREG